MLDTLLYYGTGFLLYSMMWSLPSFLILIIYMAHQSYSHGRLVGKFSECVYIKDFIIVVICYPITIIFTILVLIGLLWEAISGLRITEKVIKFLNKKVG
ncbi:hypothetical protein S140_139 [Shewanella sp. phage 1/40]|uniref:hypothetical protein n=1 Tax=Shewanella sp. phage 1/40 TaxID=1458860 RepID=UPI0004F8F8D2|nr:hypothetical protein S140_139 [Shewanella sp. phage 1/40]AHK11546.1 hypothetical protein S140_139 [Shewanella sp. phage 1/40]